MKIIAIVNGTHGEAYKVGGRVYKCFPSGTNLSRNAKDFSTIEEAARFLKANPGLEIRMNPGSEIVYESIQIVG